MPRWVEILMAIVAVIAWPLFMYGHFKRNRDQLKNYGRKRKGKP